MIQFCTAALAISLSLNGPGVGGQPPSPVAGAEVSVVELQNQIAQLQTENAALKAQVQALTAVPPSPRFITPYLTRPHSAPSRSPVPSTMYEILRNQQEPALADGPARFILLSKQID